LLGVLASSVLAEPSPLLLPGNFSYAVRIALPLHEKAVLGSGFYYRNEESTYLVTARHVLFAPTQVAVKDGATFPIPRQLLHRIRYDKAGRLLSLEGVLSSKERDAILTHPSTNESGKQVIQYLYEKSQSLKLKAHTVRNVAKAAAIAKTTLQEVVLGAHDVQIIGPQRGAIDCPLLVVIPDRRKDMEITETSIRRRKVSLVFVGLCFTLVLPPLFSAPDPLIHALRL
jgi:hypothetical protein